MVATPQLERLAHPVEVVCGLGSGDAFGGATCHGLGGWSLPDTVRYGNAAGAIVAGRMMCTDDMPTGPEVDAFLQGVILDDGSTREHPCLNASSSIARFRPDSTNSSARLGGGRPGRRRASDVALRSPACRHGPPNASPRAPCSR